jgi:hypothetical protein
MRPPVHMPAPASTIHGPGLQASAIANESCQYLRKDLSSESVSNESAVNPGLFDNPRSPPLIS